MKTNTKKAIEIEFTRVASDVNGNPRYVCHFPALINEGDKIKADTFGLGSVSHEYELAIKKANSIGGKKYHNKQYGGGLVFQMYNTPEERATVAALKEVNTDFVKEFKPADFKRVERAIKRHFQNYTYKYIKNHGDKPAPFIPSSFKEIDEFLGLAYTSTGSYAGLWVCNGGYVMANDTHHFSGFTINANNEIVATVEDKDENTIYITL